MSAGITLSDAIMALVAEKRAVGYKYHAEQRVLARFEAFSRSEFPGLDTLTEASVQGWISAARRRGVKPATLQGLAAPVRELARWLGRRGVAAYLLPGSALPRPVRYVPHIYTDRELAALVAFSFISPTTGGVSGPGQADEHAWTMHQLLRRALASARLGPIRRAHQMLEQRYAQLAAGGDFAAQLEQLYHAGQLDPGGAAAGWVAVMDRCLAAGRYDRCRAMITLLAELPVDQAGHSQCVYRVARADIGLGRWAEAQALLDSLPVESPHATLLQAELAFVRGEFGRAEFGRAEDLARAALGKAAGSMREGILRRLAVIELYRGRFSDAREHAHTGLGMAQADGDRTRMCRWNNMCSPRLSTSPATWMPRPAWWTVRSPN